ncbi:hypothetical protein NX801_02805 [Streptomyces sp. LP05-1]|uniref:SnoaL-like domain-containing protein n=1 Tax=Streptomyces pyxinae TaxID=2970734 RepID=A0ABT2CB26_9ACTN|nr:hypothetical protein [Streptomyces sp. LP05-1]MCS0634608.1 hypothetical protein [Streptomyces sp. LP05-1]
MTRHRLRPLRRRARVRAVLAANLAAYCQENDIDLLARIFTDPAPDSGPPPSRWETLRLRADDLRSHLHHYRARLRMAVRWWCTPPARRREIERAAAAMLSRLPPT